MEKAFSHGRLSAKDFCLGAVFLLNWWKNGGSMPPKRKGFNARLFLGIG